MGKGDRRHSQKSKHRLGQRKLKARIKKGIETAKAAAAAEKTPEKKRPARSRAAAAPSA